MFVFFHCQSKQFMRLRKVQVRVFQVEGEKVLRVFHYKFVTGEKKSLEYKWTTQTSKVNEQQFGGNSEVQSDASRSQFNQQIV